MITLCILSVSINIILMLIIRKYRIQIKKLTPKYKVNSYKKDRKLLNSRTEELLNSYTGEEFEQLCCEILSKTGYREIYTTRATGDFGIDVICEKDGIRYGIQCKCYSNPVGVHAIEEAYSGCAYYGCDIPVVMTNNYFTDAAQEMARVLRVELKSKSYFAETIHRLRRIF